MLLSTTALVCLALIVYGFWRMSRFMPQGAKGGRIFFLTAVSGFCLIANVVFPFLVAGAIVSVLELRSLVAQT